MNALFALLLVLQETPAEIFRKIETAVENARSLKVDFTLDGASDEGDAVMSKGYFSLQDGGRAEMSLELKSKKSKVVSITMDCDGTKVVSIIDQSRVEAPFDSKLGRSNFNMYLTRLGLFTGSFFQHGFWMGSSSRGKQAMTLDLKQVFQVENVQAAGDGKGGTRILTYDIKTAFQPTPLEKARIWYDPKTYLLVRREYQLKDKTRDVTIFEEYTDVRLGDGTGSATPSDVKTKPPPPPPIPDSELDTLFFKAKLQVAESHLKSGKKDKAIEVLEDAIKTYPKHSLVSEARRLLDEAKKK